MYLPAALRAKQSDKLRSELSVVAEQDSVHPRSNQLANTEGGVSKH
jgi:hypothetical protein